MKEVRTMVMDGRRRLNTGKVRPKERGGGGAGKREKGGSELCCWLHICTCGLA